jgi:hypothetical protein
MAGEETMLACGHVSNMAEKETMLVTTDLPRMKGGGSSHVCNNLVKNVKLVAV